VTPQVRVCQIDACSERVPASLIRHGVCLSHYLDDAFTHVAEALELCRQGQPLDSHTVDDLFEQGDFAVQLLAKEGLVRSSEQRAKLLELLLCLANIREYVRHHLVSKVT
jgi:hypothetical protein